jgi:hypothetical protein
VERLDAGPGNPGTPELAGVSTGPTNVSLDPKQVQEQAQRELEQMREVLGVKAVERRLELFEAALQQQAISSPAGGAPPGGLDIGKLLQDPFVKGLLDTLVKGLEHWMGGGSESENQRRQRSLFDKVQERYEARMVHDMEDLADRIVEGKGLLIEKEGEETDKVGRPDGKGLQK